MKNMKVAQKLILSFMVVAIFTAIVGVVGIVGMSRIAHSESEMYETQTLPLPYLATVNETLQLMRVNVREMIIYSMAGDMARVEGAFSIIEGYMPIMEENLDAFKATRPSPEAIKLFEEARSLYSGELTSIVLSIYESAKVHDDAGMIKKLDSCKNVSEIIVDNFSKCMAYKVGSAAELARSSSDLSVMLLVVIAATLILALAIAIFLSIYISGLIGKPIVPLTNL
jgi:methyl-accepting chemotaxis protein